MEQVVRELHKPARKNFHRRRTILKGIDDLWQIDLADFQQYARQNKGYKFILVVIDCFSKYVWTEPVKDKSGVNVAKAMSNILKRSGTRIPKHLQSDNGKEFYNKHFSDLMRAHSINHYSTFSTKKAAIVERVIRTLKNKIYLQFSLRGKYQYHDVLDKIVDTYNNTIHSVIKMKPKQVTKDKEKILLNSVYSHLKIAGKQRFKIGDIVRISKEKAIFEKGYTPNWSTELFKIVKIKISNPTVYYLQDMNGHDIKGAFYYEELQKAKYDDVYLVEKILRRKGKKVYVKFLGLDKSHNTWLDKTNVLK